MDDLKELGGGGSGVTIIKGVDTTFGDLVLKHGGSRDSEEHFALATIEEDLRLRGSALRAVTEAADMVQRTPDFEFIYITQRHLWDRAAEGWNELRDKFLSPSSRSSGSGRLSTWMQSPCRKSMSGKVSAKQLQGIEIQGPAEIVDPKSAGPLAEEDDLLVVRLAADSRSIRRGLQQGRAVRCSAKRKGYEYLKHFYTTLCRLQRQHEWKFTLAQKAIGHSGALTASIRLARGELCGTLLQTLINEMIHVMRNLVRLTFPTEARGIDHVLRELSTMTGPAWPSRDSEETGCETIFGIKPGAAPPASAEDLSDVADAFVGFAVKKNFDPRKGRFRKLRDLGAKFRSGFFDLSGREAEPGKWLGEVLREGVRTEDFFTSPPMSPGPTALDVFMEADDKGATWWTLIQHATGLENPAALSTIWTCGLMDVGLHNMFLGSDRIWLFDLGPPSLVSLPAFLTKFLFSFFHTLGMQEDDEGIWINRFEFREDEGGGRREKLSLTQETLDLLPKVREAYISSVRKFVKEVFGNEVAVYELLLKYTVLQLLSDAAFCLDKWESKRCSSQGIAQDEAEQGRRALHKWLWRALWDLYIASDVCGRDWSEEGITSRTTKLAVTRRQTMSTQAFCRQLEQVTGLGEPLASSE